MLRCACTVHRGGRQGGLGRVFGGAVAVCKGRATVTGNQMYQS